MTTNISDRYMVVSSDCHAGASLLDYKPYLEAKWHGEFDDWAATFSDPWLAVDRGVGADPIRIGVASGLVPTNWESDLRLRALEADGIVGEVIFGNTAPPFFPSGALTASTPATRDEYERRWAGVRAHNRWLVDFCAKLPGRRAGIAELLVNDIDDAVAEIEWTAKSGLTGGIQLPIVEPECDLPQIFSKVYEPIWEAAAHFDITINSHSMGGAMQAVDPDGRMVGRTVGLIESGFLANRTLWHLIFGGVFERHPTLRFVMTEQSVQWVPERLAVLDGFYKEAKIEGSAVHALVGPTANDLSMLPSEYFARNCFMGASAMMPSEVSMRHTIGVANIMWGADYPHSEGTTPYSREAMRLTFKGVPEDECRAMLGETAARLYKLDIPKLREAANRVGPTVEEIAQPLPVDEWPQCPTETRSQVFSKVFHGL